MSMPNIPDVSPDIDIKKKDVINLLLASIAFEELGLAHLINAEAEKIQFVLGTLHKKQKGPEPCFEQVIEINETVNKAMRAIIIKQILLQTQMEDVLRLISEEDKDHDKDEDDEDDDEDDDENDEDDDEDDDEEDDDDKDDDCDYKGKWWKPCTWIHGLKCLWKKGHDGKDDDKEETTEGS